MRYLKYFEKFEFEDNYYNEKSQFTQEYREWYKLYSENEKKFDEILSKRIKELIDSGLKFKEAYNKSYSEYKENITKWKENNPPPIFKTLAEYEKESDIIEGKIDELINRLGLNRTGNWGDSPMDEELGNFNIKEQTILAVKPHYADDDGEELELVDGIKLELIMTNPKHRGKGLATKRMKEFLKVVDDLQLKTFIIVSPQTEDTDKDRLIKFYENFGFKLIDDWGNYASMERDPF